MYICPHRQRFSIASIHLLRNCSFRLRKPDQWGIALALRNPVSVAMFLQVFKPGRCVLQVRRVPAAPAQQCLAYVAISEQLLVDPADNIRLPLTEDSFTLLAINQVQYGLEVVPR